MIRANIRQRVAWIIISASFFSAHLAAAKALHFSSAARAASLQTAASPVGQSATLLPDGRMLLLGGEGADGRVTNAAVIKDLESGVLRPLPAALNLARAWHTATVLPDGTVLVL